MFDVQVIGGGKMGEALLGGLLATGWTTTERAIVVEPSADRRAELSEGYPGLLVQAIPESGVDTILAVKPNIVLDVAEQLGILGPRRVLSVAAGVKIADFEAVLPAGTPVIRAIPNTPALVGLGAAAVAGGTSATTADVAWASEVLSSVGIVEVVEEVDIDAVTGLSGSGPAYVFLLAEAMIAAGQQVGLSESTSVALVNQTLLGAATLLTESGDSAAVLRRNVTSPNGTTAAGLAVFGDHDFGALVAEVVQAARDRSVELGDS
ncbi:MAG: pyrroline-5-carboxylate reductase [Acidimicrobiales bacterium]